jgi:hypothetical protein
VEVGVLIDLRDLGVICDSKGVRRASLRMVVDANSDRGASTMAIDRNYDLVMPAEAYQKALRTGMLFTVTLHLPAAGIWRVRAVAADGVSDRLGSSVQCLDVPARDAFSMTGLALRVFDPDGVENPPAEPKQNEAARIFRSGRTLQFSYFVFNPLADESKQAHLEIITRLYVKGHAAFVGAPSQVPYANEPGTRRQITQRLKLSAEVVPGDYILEVTVSDKLAPPAAPRSVSRFIDFQVLD